MCRCFCFFVFVFIFYSNVYALFHFNYLSTLSDDTVTFYFITFCHLTINLNFMIKIKKTGVFPPKTEGIEDDIKVIDITHMINTTITIDMNIKCNDSEKRIFKNVKSHFYWLALFNFGKCCSIFLRYSH